MKKYTTLAVSLGLLVMGLLLVATAAKADFFLWLDAPTKKSPYHIAALTETAIAKSGALPTSTDTRTSSPTSTFTSVPAGSTATSTQTPGPVSTATSTVTPGSGPVLGANVIMSEASSAAPASYTMASSVAPLPCWGAGYAYNATGGPASNGAYVELTMTCDSGNFVAGYLGFGYTAGGAAITYDASGSTSLEISYRIPNVTPPTGCINTITCNWVDPNVVLVSSGGQSLPVSATAFLTTADWPGQGAWVTAKIPLTAFVDGAVFTTAMLPTVQGIIIQPGFGTYTKGTGAFSGVVDVTNIQFTTNTPVTAPTMGGVIYPKLVTDCEHPDGGTTWNTYWFWWADICGSDGSNCVAVGQAGPYGCSSGSETQITYPGYTAGNPTSSILPFQANDKSGAIDSSCNAAHLSGFMGDGSGSNSCTGWSSCGFGFNLYVAGAANQYANLSPSGLNFTGVRFKAKNGATATGPMYITLPKASVTDNSDFRYIIGSTTANGINGGIDPALTTSWQQYQLPFTAFGCPTVEGNSGWTGNMCDGVANAEYLTDALCSDLGSVKFQPENQMEAFDLWIDDVEFY
jgi:hypothetical protein